MATRALTTNERNVLAHMVIDPDAWWEHATNWGQVDEEAALADKVARWQSDYEAAVAAGNYQTRAEREAAE